MHEPPRVPRPDELLPAETRAFYCRALETLEKGGVPFLVGGAYAFARYTGIERHTKDFDVFVREADAKRALSVFRRAGYHAEMTFPHWLGKAFCEDDFVDVIFASGNGIATVDEEWFEHAVDERVFDRDVKLCPPEEIIWSKSFVQERERFDGADIAHILRARAESLDWDRLLRRYGDRWRVLLQHLVLFGFVYPAERTKVPARVMRELIGRLEREIETPDASRRKVCQGTLVSREQYLVDIDRWGYADARIEPRGQMSQEDVDHWTAAIDEAA